MEAVGQLAGGVAHVFNNILSVILSYTEMVLTELKTTDPLRADIREIHTAGERATQLTTQLLAFSRHQTTLPRVLDPDQLVLSMETMAQRLVGASIELNLLVASSPARIRMDPGHLEQVLLNLVINARDAMPDGGTLTVETKAVDLDDEYATDHHGVAAGPYVLVAVSDTGIGISKETQGRIFEPFFTTKERGKGTGLGLSTVFGLVKQGGGHIWVYSEPGAGSTFKIYLPRIDAPVTPVAERPAANVTTGNETILLVEDDPQVRGVACHALRQAGYCVVEAANGGEALLACEQHGAAIHLLLTDVVLPRMSGRQLAARLKAMRPRMNVLFMSGYTDEAVSQHGILESDVAYFQKPITPEKLRRKVREVLDAVPSASS
jgi:CheY-like chemotaxis protein